MAETAVGSAHHIRLSDFLDSLPRTPCEITPQNRYFCTVCERLNKGVASRCKYSSIEGDQTTEGSGSKDGRVDFIQVTDDQQPPDKLGESPTAAGAGAADGERVEFKIVAPLKPNDDYPMLELVQPKDNQAKPIEMELLEDVAIEFEVSDKGEEAVEVEPLEVEPLDDEVEDGEQISVEGSDMDSEEALEVEALEVEVIDEDLESSDTGNVPADTSEKNIPQFKPLEPAKKVKAGVPQQKQIPKPSKGKKRVKKKSMKKVTVRKTPKVQQKADPTPVMSQTQPTKPTIKQTQPNLPPQPTIKPIQRAPQTMVKPVQKTGTKTLKPIPKHPPKKLKKVKK